MLGEKGVRKGGEKRGGGTGVKLPLRYLPVLHMGRSVPPPNRVKLSTGSVHKNVVVSIFMCP